MATDRVIKRSLLRRGELFAAVLLGAAIGCDGGQEPELPSRSASVPPPLIALAEKDEHCDVEAPGAVTATIPVGPEAAPRGLAEGAAPPAPVAAPVANLVAADAVKAPAPKLPALSPEAAVAFRDSIRKVVRMPRDGALQRRARSHKMRLVDLTWEDTGRWQGSSVGPNISDLTLEVIERRPKGRPRTHLLPVLRYPNFTDRTADVPADRFSVHVGNQTEGAPRETVALAQLLGHVRDYLSEPEKFRARKDDLTARRDTHYLVSAQHVFVPVPEGVEVEFAPVLFNYQSSPGAPAVLCILVTREGTSMQVIENRPDAAYPDGWGQRLYFNRAGQRTTFTAERRTDVAERIDRGEARPEDATALEKGADMVMIIQVPLVLPRWAQNSDYGFGGLGSVGTTGMGSGELEVSGSSYGSGGLGLQGSGYGGGYGNPSQSSAAPLKVELPGAERSAGRSDIEAAVVGHGLDAGPFTETRRQSVRRDRRFPIRVTIQFYRATSNGVVSEADLDAAAAQIERVYTDADFVGSLVVGSQDRPTAFTGSVTPG